MVKKIWKDIQAQQQSKYELKLQWDTILYLTNWQILEYWIPTVNGITN